MIATETLSSLGQRLWGDLAETQDADTSIHELALTVRDARNYQFLDGTPSEPSHYYTKGMDAAVSQAMEAMLRRVTMGPGTPTLRLFRLAFLIMGLILALMVGYVLVVQYVAGDDPSGGAWLLIPLLLALVVALILDTTMAVARLFAFMIEDRRHGRGLEAILPTRLAERRVRGGSG